MLNLSLLVKTLPEDLINYVKDFTLTPSIRLQLFYQKHQLDEKKLKKMLTKFTSKQLEQINWKYLYYKIYIISPPFYDNNNLVPILKTLSNITYKNVYKNVYKSVFDYEFIYNNEPSLIYDVTSPLLNYKLQNITRSDYYHVNAQTETAKKRQQYKNIISSWKAIHEGQCTSKIPKIDEYFQNLEFELIKTIILLQK
jgi:hypothetical protein